MSLAYNFPGESLSSQFTLTGGQGQGATSFTFSLNAILAEEDGVATYYEQMEAQKEELMEDIVQNVERNLMLFEQNNTQVLQDYPDQVDGFDVPIRNKEKEALKKKAAAEKKRPFTSESSLANTGDSMVQYSPQDIAAINQRLELIDSQVQPKFLSIQPESDATMEKLKLVQAAILAEQASIPNFDNNYFTETLNEKYGKTIDDQIKKQLGISGNVDLDIILGSGDNNSIISADLVRTFPYLLSNQGDDAAIIQAQKKYNQMSKEAIIDQQLKIKRVGVEQTMNMDPNLFTAQLDQAYDHDQSIKGPYQNLYQLINKLEVLSQDKRIYSHELELAQSGLDGLTSKIKLPITIINSVLQSDAFDHMRPQVMMLTTVLNALGVDVMGYDQAIGEIQKLAIDMIQEVRDHNDKYGKAVGASRETIKELVQLIGGHQSKAIKRFVSSKPLIDQAFSFAGDKLSKVTKNAVLMLADKAQKMSTDEFDEYLDDPGKIIEQLTEDFGEKVLAAAIYKDGEGEPTSQLQHNIRTLFQKQEIPSYNMKDKDFRRRKFQAEAEKKQELAEKLARNITLNSKKIKKNKKRKGSNVVYPSKDSGFLNIRKKGKMNTQQFREDQPPRVYNQLRNYK